LAASTTESPERRALLGDNSRKPPDSRGLPGGESGKPPGSRVTTTTSGDEDRGKAVGSAGVPLLMAGVIRTAAVPPSPALANPSTSGPGNCNGARSRGKPILTS